MHGKVWTAAFASAVALGAIVHGVGCYSLSSDCDLFACASSSGSSTSSSSSGTGGGDGGNPKCDGDPTMDPSIVTSECGVFVSSTTGDDNALDAGSKDKPVKTIAKALAIAGGKRVFVCAEAYAESSALSASDVEMYGGFTSCTSASGWTWQASAKATITGPTDAVTLTLNGGANVLRSVNLIAPNATLKGGSSISLVVNGGSLDMQDGALTSGDAQDGELGVTVADDPLIDGDAGEKGIDACGSGATHPGPTGKTKVCATGGMSIAGNGGDGGGFDMNMMLLAAGNGTDGSPPDLAQPTKGKGGAGEEQGAVPPAMTCVDGTSGANGGAGTSGVGASGVGSLDAMGYAGAIGVDGTNGKPGQGGGGGGGAKGAKMVSCMMGGPLINVLGASGGSGGTGGCGGALGGGGKAGGSSIALVSLDANVNLINVTLTPGKGGKGGDGGNGQNGGAKGFGGNPSTGPNTDSCRGGDGGRGGNGGPGGGGQGGHSLGIAFKTKAPKGGTATIDPLKLGKGGAGGVNNTALNMGVGEDGRACAGLDFGNPPASGCSM